MSRSTKKIVWITPDYFVSVDGPVIPLLIRHYEIDWIVVKTCGSLISADDPSGARVKARVWDLRFRQRDPRVIGQYLRMLLAVRRSTPDLVYISFHGMPYFLPLVCLMLNVSKVIYAVHNVQTPKGAVNENSMRIYHYCVFKLIQMFHVFSKGQLRAISRLAPAKKHFYAPFALQDYGRSQICAPGEVIRLLFFGHVRQYKRLDLLIEAFKDVYKSGITNIELVISGDCDNWTHYRSLIAGAEGIKTRIEFIPAKDIPNVVGACHYVVLPYQDGAQSAVLTLAYQYSKPVIASDIEALRQDVVEGRTGFLFRNGSRGSLAAVIREVVARHNAVYPDLTENVRQYAVREYSLESIVARYRGLLDACLAESGV